MAKKKRGRPAGARTETAVEVHRGRTQCPRCGSTARKNFRGPARLIKGPVQNPDDGEWYQQKTGRRTRCSKCGQVRMEWEYEEPVPKRSGEDGYFIVGL